MGDAAAAVSPPAALGKRRRGGGGDEEGLRRVAEIVMVLAAAGQARGGRAPTAAERALAAEARERLAAAVAEGAVRPRDLFPGEAVRAVVEDLGLNRARDPASMGFRPPKASIADRLMLTKRKMEEVKEAPVQPAASMPHTIVSSSTADFQGFHGAAKFSVGAPKNPPAVAAFPATAPVTSATLVTLKPPGSSPVKPVTNPSVPLPHTGPSHVKLDKGVNGPLNLARSGATVGHFNKSLHDTSARSNLNTAQSSNQVMKNKDTKAVNTEATTGNPLMGHNAAAGVATGAAKPYFANHNEIAKNVQNFLRQPANHPIWTPPSTEYMHSRLDCQICKVAIMDVESLLVCDSCEKGAHLKCLQHYGNKGVPKAEWHCPTCLTRSKGKPLPPKYGKVTRTVVDPKTAPPPGGTQLPSQGEANHAAKENPEKMVANGNILKPNSMPAGRTVHNSTVLAPNVTAAGSQSQSQSQSSSTSRTPEGIFNNTGSSSNDKDGNVGQSSITSQHNKIPDELQSSELPAVSNTGSHSGKFRNEQLPSVLALYSVDATNNTLNGQKSTAISAVKCSDNSFVVAAEENIKPEAQSELVPSSSVKMVDIGVTPMYQTNSIATLATSQPHTMKDVEVITNTGTPIDQGGNVSAEEKSQTTSEPHPIKDVAVTTNTGTPIDQSSNAASEVKPLSEPTYAIEVAEMATNAVIPPNQFQQANGSAENDRKECANGETDKDKSYCNEMSDVGMTQQLAANGVIHPKDAAREEAI